MDDFTAAVREMTDEQLADFIREYRELERRASQLRHASSMGTALEALEAAYSEKNHRAAGGGPHLLP